MAVVFVASYVLFAYEPLYVAGPTAPAGTLPVARPVFATAVLTTALLITGALMHVKLCTGNRLLPPIAAVTASSMAVAPALAVLFLIASPSTGDPDPPWSGFWRVPAYSWLFPAVATFAQALTKAKMYRASRRTSFMISFLVGWAPTVALIWSVLLGQD